MIKTNHFGIRFEGNKFSPKLLETLTGFPLKVLAEYGEISKKGRYKGQPSPYGMAFLDIDYELKENNLIEVLDKYTTILLRKKGALNESHVDEIIFDIETSKNNVPLEGEVLRKLGELNAKIEIKTTTEEDELTKLLEDIDFILERSKSAEYHKVQGFLKNRLDHSKISLYLGALNSKTFLSHQHHRHSESSKTHVALGAFFVIYLISYLNTDEKDIPSFEKAYEEYSKKLH